MQILHRARVGKVGVFAGLLSALIGSTLQVLPPTEGSLLPRVSEAKAAAQTSAAPNCTFPSGANYGTPTMSRVSVGPGGVEANSGSAGPSVSSDGQKVAYMSLATNLTGGDTNGAKDIFVTDRASGQTVKASVGNNNVQTNYNTDSGVISGDGSQVGFTSLATNLQGGDGDKAMRVYEVDEEVRLPAYALSGATTETLELWFNTTKTGPLVGYANTVPPYTPTEYVPVLYVDWDGKLRGQFWHGAPTPITSANKVNDGRWHHVVLTSYAGVYQFLYVDGVYQGYLYGTINHLSMHWVTLARAYSSLGWPRLDPYPAKWLNLGWESRIDEVAIYRGYMDGNRVAAHYAARASNFAAQVALDRPYGYWRLGEPVDSAVAIDSSGNGRHGWYLSHADDHLGAYGALTVDTNDREDVYVRDLKNNTTKLVSATHNGAQADFGSYLSDMSANGQFVAFMSGARNIVAQPVTASHMYLRDTVSNTTELISVNNAGVEGNWGSTGIGRVSADGRYVVFASLSSNLAANDAPSNFDVFLRDRRDKKTILISRDLAGNPAGDSLFADMSADGRFVTYYSSSPNLVPGDTNGQTDVFLYDVQEQTTVKVSHGMNGAQPNGGSWYPSISGDGRYVTYSTLATNVVPNDTNSAADLILWDRVTGQTSLVNRTPSGTPSNAGGPYQLSILSALSHDGSKIVFAAASTDLVPNDTNGQPDVFLFDQGAAGGFQLAPTLTNELVAQSDEIGLEQFYPYRTMSLGTGTAYTQLRTGNLVAQFEDESVPGQGLNAVLRHTYNSQRWTNDTGLGPGWTLSLADADTGLDSVLGNVGDLTAAIGDLDITRALNVINIGKLLDNGVWQALGQALEFTDADGTTHRFVRNGPPCSGWLSPPGVNLKVREEMDPLFGSLLTRAYEFVRPDGIVYRAEPVSVGLLGLPTWRIVSVSDRNGNKLTYKYVATGIGVAAPVLGAVRVASITHNRYPNDPLVEFSYTGNRLTKVVTHPRLWAADPGSPSEASRLWARATTFDYHPDGQLKSVTQNAEGPVADRRTTSYTYENGRLASVTDGRNNVTRLAYDAQWRVWNVEDRASKVWNFTYEPLNQQTAEQVTKFKTPRGDVTEYAISGRFNLPDGRRAGGNIVRITDAGTDAGPVTHRYTWSKNRLVSSSTDGANNTRRFEYDDLGLLTRTFEPAPNDPDRTDLPPGAPRGEIENELTYDYPQQFRYPVYSNQTQQPCTDPPPTQTPEPVSDARRCYMVADLVKTTFAKNIPGATRVTEFAPDPRGNVLRVTQKGDTTNPDRTTTFTYYDFGGLETADGPRTDIDDKTTFGVGRALDPAYGGYDRTGQPTRLVDAQPKEKLFAYTPYGLVGKVKDRDDKVTRNSYDENDKLLKVIDPMGHETTYRYNGNNQRIEESSPGGKVTVTAYDPNDRVTEVRGPTLRAGLNDADTPVLTTQWNDDGTKQFERNALGGQTNFTYWPNGSTKEMRAPATGETPAVTSYQYDTAGRLKTITSPKASELTGDLPTETVTYTPNGAIATRTATSPLDGQPAGRTFAYSAHGQEIEVLGPRSEGSTTASQATTYTPFGEVATTVRRLAGREPLKTSYRYDVAGNQIGATQPGQGEGQVRYDGLGRVIWRNDPQNPGHTTDFTYSGEGKQLTRVDRGIDVTERRTVYTYNGDGTRSSTVAVQGAKALAMCNFPAGADLADRADGYDADGNLLITRTVDWIDFPGAATDVEGKACNEGGRTLVTQTLVPDHRNFLKQATQTISLPGEASVSRTQVIVPDRAGRWDEVSLREGPTENGAVKSSIDFTYDPSGSGWLTGMTGLGHTTSSSYLPSGNPLNMTLSAPTPITADFDYHREGSLAKLVWSQGAASPRAHTGLAYDVGGLRTSEHIRLPQPSGPASEGDARFTYDLADRLQSWDDPFSPGGAVSFTLDDAGNVEKETAADGRVLADPQYDANGRLVSRGSVTFSYDGLGQEKARTGLTTEYDAAGHARTRTTGDTVTSTYYDGMDRLIGRVETGPGTKTVTLYFSWGTGSSLAEETDGAGATKVLYLAERDAKAIGQQATDGGWTWLLADAAGNVGTRVADDGTIVEQKAYDPYGKPSAGTAKGVETKESTLGFQGHVVDPKSGSVVLGARLYDPDIRRFTTPDTFVASTLDVALGTDPLTGNRYMFAAANPVGVYDDGHWPWSKNKLYDQYATQIHRAAKLYGVSPRLLAAIIQHEGYNRQRLARFPILGPAFRVVERSRVGEKSIGIGQMYPENVVMLVERYKDTFVVPLNMYLDLDYSGARQLLIDNSDFAIEMSALYLRYLRDEYGFDDRRAFIAYGFDLSESLPELERTNFVGREASRRGKKYDEIMEDLDDSSKY